MKLSLLASLLAVSTLAAASMEPGRSSVKARHGSMMRRLKDSVLGTDSGLVKRGTPGRATFYDVGEGACGAYNTANQKVVALNIAQYGDENSVSKYCFKNIEITYQGKTETAQIVDCCPTCPYGGLDMSRGLFGSLADFSLGVFQMSWNFVGEDDDEESTSSTEKTTHSHYTPTTTAKKIKATTSSSSSSSSSSSVSTQILVLATPTATASTSSSSSSAAPTSTQANNLEGLSQVIQGFKDIAQGAQQ